MKNSQIELKIYLLILVSLSIFFLIISNPFQYYFLNDDFIHIPQAANKNFLHGGSLFRPLSDLSLWIDSYFWEKNAVGFHITNIVFHLTNVFLVYISVKALYIFFDEDVVKAKRSSLIACTLFLIYAFHSESIYWILGRGASLCTLLFLSALFSYLQASKSKLCFVLTLVFFLLGLLTYELIWIFPIIITCIYFFHKKKSNLLLLLCIWALFIAYLFLKMETVGKLAGSYELRSLQDFDIKKLIYNYNALLARTFLPPLRNSYVFFVLYMLVLAGLAIVFYFLRKNKIIQFSLLCLLISLLPVISLGIDTHDSEYERFIYLASFFCILFIVETLNSFKSFYSSFLYFGLLVFHTYYLYQSAESYKHASLITSRTLFCIPKNQTYGVMYLYNLPSQYKGALIFRIGFPEAVSWISGINYKKICLLKVQEIQDAAIKVKCIQQATMKNKTLYVKLPDEKRFYKDKDDIVMIWNNGSLKTIY